MSAAPLGPSTPTGDGSPCEAGKKKGRYPKSALAGTDSDYLCLFCYSPLYVCVATGKEACLNPECIDYTPRGEFTGDLGAREGPLEARERCEASIREFRRFDRRFLLGKIHEARAAECSKLYGRGGMNISIVAALDYLAMRLRGNKAWGDSQDYRAWCGALGTYCADFDNLEFVESLRSKTYILTAGGDVFAMKYQYALSKILGSLGVADASRGRDQSKPLPFHHIDGKARGGPAKNVFDFEAIFKNMLPVVSALNHSFKMSHSRSKMYGYPARAEEFAALASLWANCLPGRAATVTVDGLRKIYDGAARRGGIRGDFGRFLDDYTSGRTCAPILIFDGENYRFDYPALLAYLLYLFSNITSPPSTQGKTGSAAYISLKMKASGHFEENIRQKLRDDGFEVYPAPGQGQLRVSFDNQRAELDCIAVDRVQKTIVILEAKYEDIAPSSKAPATLVDQAVLDRRRGLLGQAKRHHCRRRLFRDNFGGMRRYGLDLEGSFLDYTVRTLLVTKHEPLISRHMAVDIMSYARFMSAGFRGGRRGARKSRNRGHAT